MHDGGRRSRHCNSLIKKFPDKCISAAIGHNIMHFYLRAFHIYYCSDNK